MKAFCKYRLIIFLLVTSSGIPAGVFSQTGFVSISQFEINPGTGKDASRAVRKAIDYCAENKISKLVFPKGRYDFYPDKTYEDFMFVSNNNDGLKSVVFLLDNFTDFEIDGQGSDFVFHGYICPVILKNSTNVKFTNFSIDYARTFHSEGIIKAIGNNYIDVSFSEHYPYKIENERLKFYDNETKRSEYPFGNLLEFDPVKKETAFKVRDYYIGNNIKAVITDEGNVRVFVNGITGTVGNIMVFAPNHRHCPAITVHKCKDVHFEGIKLYHSGGMGIIAQLCENITINNLKSTTSPLWERVVGCTADVTHFSNCTGKIVMTNSLFENQMDDATNVHGIYMRIEEILNPNTLSLRLVHYEQLGMDIFFKGDILEIVDANTVETYAQVKVKEVKRLNKDLTEIEFEQELPKLVKINDVIGATVFPEIEIKNCIIQKNRARGILLGSRERILVEGNFFHTSGASILSGGDTKYWFEQGGVSNLTIRNNIFKNCLFGTWGNAVIQLSAGSARGENDAPRFNNNVVIENNEFIVFDPRLLNVTSVDGLIFRNNKITKSTDYPVQNTENQPFVTRSSINVQIEESASESVIWYPVAPPKPAVKNNSVVLLPASRDYHSTCGIPLQVVFNHWLRDPHILNAPDGYYYMIGTAEKSTLPVPILASDRSNGWWYNDGIPLWRTKDLVSWETMGYVWTFEKDATWAKGYKHSPHTRTPDNALVRAMWAPEMHYIKGNYWIVYSMNYNGLGILKSTTGRPEGPYTDIHPEGPLPGVIDGSLFEDTDGSVYFFSDGYKIARMKDDMSGLAEEPRRLEFNPAPPWAEGISMMKVNDNYVWYSAANSIVTINGKEERTYDCFSATSKSIYGPYNNRYRAIPYAGHNNIFRDHDGNFQSTQFHPQPFMNKALEPALIPVEVDETGIISVKRSYPRPVWKYVEKEPTGKWMDAKYNDAAWSEGEAGFGNPEIQNIGSVSDVGTSWTTNNIWMRKNFHLDNIPANPYLFLRFDGSIRIWINGSEVYSGNDSPLEYVDIPIASGKLKKGENTIAIEVTKKTKYQYIDAGLIDRKTK